MSEADKLKDQLLQALLQLWQAAREGHVGLNITGEYNRILVIAHDQLGLDIRDLSVTEGERNIALFRHADDPVSRRPLTPEEWNRCLMDGDAFRRKLGEAINRLDAFVPPRDRIGFV
jgi:hypothetical protein